MCACMCACVYVCMCLCVHVLMCACAYVCMCVCVHLLMCACVYVCMCVCVHVYVHVCMCLCTCIPGSQSLKAPNTSSQIESFWGLYRLVLIPIKTCGLKKVHKHSPGSMELLSIQHFCPQHALFLSSVHFPPIYHPVIIGIAPPPPFPPLPSPLPLLHLCHLPLPPALTEKDGNGYSSGKQSTQPSGYAVMGASLVVALLCRHTATAPCWQMS